jgi:HK97 family phage major capsid protein
MSFRMKALREQRWEVKQKMDAIRGRINSESRNMTETEQAAWDELKASYADLGQRIKDIEGASNGDGGDGGDDPASSGRQARSRVPGKHNMSGEGNHMDDDDDDTSARGSREDRAYAFQAWCRVQYGMDLTRRHQSALQRTGVDPKAKEFAFRHSRSTQQRAMSLTGNAGGYTVAQDFSGALEQALVSQSNVRGICGEFRTDTGADLPYPTSDDTSNTGEQLAEATEVAYASASFSTVTFKAWKFSSKAILVSNELLQDSAFNLEQIIGDQAGTRIGKIQGSKFTTGAGTTEPKGVVTCASAGLTTASATAATGVELTKLAFSVDPAYRIGPKVGYMMHDSVQSYFMNLLDSTGRPLLRESYRDGMLLMTLNGFPVWTNQFMEPAVNGALVTAKKHVLFGDFDRFKIRDAGPVRLRRLDERWAETDQVGFIAFLRSDSNCVNTAAIKYLLQA